MERVIPFIGFSEPVSSWSHLLAALASLVGMIFLIKKGKGSRVRLTALIIFSISQVFLFSMSGTYHLLDLGTNAREVMKILDHAAIWVLVAGTFTSIHVILFRGVWRWGILLLVWSVAINGIVLKTIYFDEIPDWLSIVFYLSLGWVGILTYFRFIKEYGTEDNRFFIWGGIAYTFGALIDGFNWPTLWPNVIGPHEVFHGFVILGATFHWWFIYRWADHPVMSILIINVTVYSDKLYIAKALGESIKVEADNIDILREKIKHAVEQRFHKSQRPKQIRLRYFHEEQL